MQIAGFDWDEGNWPKCGKHGVSRAEIEQVLLGAPSVMQDPCPGEPRLRAIGKTAAGRHVFLVFMLRDVAGFRLIRPISARQNVLTAHPGLRKCLFGMRCKARCAAHSNSYGQAPQRRRSPE